MDTTQRASSIDPAQMRGGRKMIKKLSARSLGTLVANPRRKRKGRKARRNPSRSGKSLAALLARNPRHKLRRRRASRNPSRNPMYAKRRHSRRNPSISMGDVNLVDVALGSAAAIAVASVGQAITEKYLSSQGETVRKLAPNVLTAAAAYFAHKKLSGKAKSVAKFAFIGACFKLVDDLASAQIQDAVGKILPGSSGMYVPALRGSMGGALIDSTGGAYVDTGAAGLGGFLPKANLYGL